jgi:hypothetical protein
VIVRGRLQSGRSGNVRNRETGVTPRKCDWPLSLQIFCIFKCIPYGFRIIPLQIVANRT